MEQTSTRQRILEEALRLFSQNGYEAVSVERIAKAVGIKAPSLYKHYKSKRDIFNSIVERMNQIDYERAKQYGMPEGTIDQMAEAYGSTPFSKIQTYSKAQFQHWTEEKFASGFRKMLTLEQYRNEEMSALYQQYLVSGPLQYMENLFAKMTQKPERAKLLALSFYAPIFTLYSVYDGGADREEILEQLHSHIDRFAAELNEE